MNCLVSTWTNSSWASYTKKPGYTARNTGSQHSTKKQNSSAARFFSGISSHLRTRFLILVSITFPVPAALFLWEFLSSSSSHPLQIQRVKIAAHTAMDNHIIPLPNTTFSHCSSEVPKARHEEKKKADSPAARTCRLSRGRLSSSCPSSRLPPVSVFLPPKDTLSASDLSVRYHKTPQRKTPNQLLLIIRDFPSRFHIYGRHATPANARSAPASRFIFISNVLFFIINRFPNHKLGGIIHGNIHSAYIFPHQPQHHHSHTAQKYDSCHQ
ncbi:hypothetical protein IMSAG025_00846 [Muribaculaceae bacterium]|nr:hypothetical protein IMSAG025_00846 [Muribaculaceae bacterium]